MIRWTIPLLALLLLSSIAGGQYEERGEGTVYDENHDQAPPGCDSIVGNATLDVRGGRQYAGEYPGTTFTFNNRSFEVEPCTRITVTFHNDDTVRHMWMVHDVWPNGTFLLEVDGPGSITGSFVTGPEVRTLLTHCGMPQHQQKGMKSQLLVGGGMGDLPNIPGISGLPLPPSDPFATGRQVDRAPDEPTPNPIPLLLLAAAMITAAMVWDWRRK